MPVLPDDHGAYARGVSDEAGVDAQALLSSTPHAVFVVDHDSRVRYANRSAAVLLGKDNPQDLIDTLLLALFADDQRAVLEQLIAGLAAESPTPTEAAYLRLEGEPEAWVAVRAAPVPGDGDQVQLAVVDVTSRVADAQRLRESEQSFRAAFDSSAVGMALVSDQRFVRVNPALCAFLGRTADWLIGRSADEVTLPEDVAVTQEVSRALREGRTPTRVAKRYLRADGEVVHGAVTAVRLPGDEGLVLAQIEDVTDRYRSEQELRRLATHDVLTQLPGRALLMERLAGALDGRRRGDALVAVMFIDLDGFKLINDALGHAAGDEVLVQTAARLLGTLRPQDVVGRFGGDEFLALFIGLDRPDDVAVLASRVRSALAVPVPYGDDEILVSASVGVAVTGADPVTPEQLVGDADAAMYRAKQLGKSRYEIFDQAMAERATERLRIEALIRSAAAQDRVVVHYQPVVELTTRRAVGLEALVRLKDDDGTLLPPGRFLDVAEQAGLLTALDDVVIGLATRQVQQWRTALGHDLTLAVNVCAGQVGGSLAGTVEAALRASGLPANRLLVELTEQTLIDRGPAATATVAHLHAQGVKIGIDDFGTGWASLTYLRRFPVSVVKIDRSFVAGIPDHHEDLVIVRTIVDLAKQLGLECIAEGVETEEQYAALLTLAPPCAQGYLFGRPTPASEVPALLARIGVRT